MASTRELPLYGSSTVRWSMQGGRPADCEVNPSFVLIARVSNRALVFLFDIYICSYRCECSSYSR